MHKISQEYWLMWCLHDCKCKAIPTAWLSFGERCARTWNESGTNAVVILIANDMTWETQKAAPFPEIKERCLFYDDVGMDVQMIIIAFYNVWTRHESRTSYPNNEGKKHSWDVSWFFPVGFEAIFCSRKCDVPFAHSPFFCRFNNNLLNI